MKEDTLTGQFNAEIWAKEFVERIKKKPGLVIDIDFMCGWFADAIMAGYDKAKQQYCPVIPQ